MVCQFNSKVSVKKVKEQHKCHRINFRKHRSSSALRNYKSTPTSQLDSLLSETLESINTNIYKFVKSVPIRSYSDGMRENAGENNSENEHS